MRDLKRLEEKIDERFERIDERFEKIDGKFERLDEKIDSKIEGLRSDIKLDISSQFKRITTIISLLFGFVVVLITILKFVSI